MKEKHVVQVALVCTADEVKDECVIATRQQRIVCKCFWSHVWWPERKQVCHFWELHWLQTQRRWDFWKCSRLLNPGAMCDCSSCYANLKPPVLVLVPHSVRFCFFRLDDFVLWNYLHTQSLLHKDFRNTCCNSLQCFMSCSSGRYIREVAGSGAFRFYPAKCWSWLSFYLKVCKRF